MRCTAVEWTSGSLFFLSFLYGAFIAVLCLMDCLLIVDGLNTERKLKVFTKISLIIRCLVPYLNQCGHSSGPGNTAFQSYR